MTEGSEFAPTTTSLAASLTDEDQNEALHRLSAVQRLLFQAMAHASDRDVVSAFAEALAVCEDLEVRGYVETVQGRFQLEVTLAGSDVAGAPLSLRHDGLPEQVALLRLNAVDTERFGFRLDTDVLVTRVGDQASVPWLLAFSGTIRASDETRLLVYVDLLDQALRTVIAHAAARVNWSILEHLLPNGDNVEPAAQAALAALSTAVGGAGAALVVTMVTGMHVLSLGSAEVFSSPRPYGEGDEIVATSQILDQYSMTLAVRRLDGRTFTRRERHFLDIAAPMFATWLSGVLRQPIYGKDRRGAPRRFDEVVERVALRAVEDGANLSLVLFRVGDGAVRSQALRRWIADIRGQLRSSDLAGLVSEDEIAVLLADTTPDHAESVMGRLRHQLEVSDQLSGLAPAAVGIASCGVDRPVAGSVLRAARADAARRASA